jgi:hypothetical protein
MEPLTDPRMRAKRQLAEAMRDLPRRRSRLNRWLLAAGMALSFVAAGGAAYFTVRPQVLAPPQHGEKSGVQREENEWRQWFRASRIGTEGAWKSVIDYPGVSEVAASRARQQLVRIYLFREQSRNFDRAIEVCNELAKSSDKEFRAFGLAGKCGALSLKGMYSESDEALEEFWPLQQDLLDVPMKKLLRLAAEKNREKLGPPPSLESEEWLKEVFSTSG